MLQQVNQTEARNLEWPCEAVSPMDDRCDSSATFRCDICGHRFCAVHAEDETYHTCAFEPGDEGGEA
jgi:predicted nucleic acid binding AN1-type Zn finger protein